MAIDGEHKPSLTDILRKPAEAVQKGITKAWFLNKSNEGGKLEIPSIGAVIDLSKSESDDTK